MPRIQYAIAGPFGGHIRVGSIVRLGTGGAGLIRAKRASRALIATRRRLVLVRVGTDDVTRRGWSDESVDSGFNNSISLCRGAAIYK